MNPCLLHGSTVPEPDTTYPLCRAQLTVLEVLDERARQYARYGTNADLEDGTGPDVRWIPNIWDAYDSTAEGIEAGLRADYEATEVTQGKITWMHLVREEVAEAFAESDPARLREELIQVAALCVSWVEKLDDRAAEPEPEPEPEPPVGQRRRSPDGVEVIKTEDGTTIPWRRYRGKTGRCWFADAEVAGWEVVLEP